MLLLFMLYYPECMRCPISLATKITLFINIKITVAYQMLVRTENEWELVWKENPAGHQHPGDL